MSGKEDNLAVVRCLSTWKKARDLNTTVRALRGYSDTVEGTYLAMMGRRGRDNSQKTGKAKRGGTKPEMEPTPEA
jgi:hypothetical protein